MRIRILLAAAIAILGVSASAQAVTFGEPDDVDHPYVVLVAFYDEDATFIQRCSGTLLSAQLVLTAGHCTEGATFAKVWNDPVVDPAVGWTLGLPVTYPGFHAAAFPDSNDVGVVELIDPIPLTTYGSLPSLDYLEPFATRRGPAVPFSLVGYGVQSVKPFFQAVPARYAAPAALVSLHDALTGDSLVRLSGHPAGACLGDSGGPVLDDDTVTAIVLASMPNPNCKGPYFATRIDQEPLRSWIAGFLA